VADAVIETRDLRKRFGDVAAVRGLDLRVEPGSICGFLGRNGAGKTTTMKMLLGMTRPDAGSASVLGLDAADPAASVDIRARVAFISDEKDLFNAFTVAQMIRFTSPFTIHEFTSNDSRPRNPDLALRITTLNTLRFVYRRVLTVKLQHFTRKAYVQMAMPIW